MNDGQFSPEPLTQFSAIRADKGRLVEAETVWSVEEGKFRNCTHARTRTASAAAAAEQLTPKVSTTSERAVRALCRVRQMLCEIYLSLCRNNVACSQHLTV